MSARRMIQIRKRGGISSIKTKTGKITPRLFKQEVKDPNSDGELIGDYKQPTFMGTRQPITPVQDDVTGDWLWGGTDQDLIDCIKGAQLRKYEGKDRGYPKYGDIIEPGDVERRLKDPNDPFFRHPDLWNTVVLEGGKFNLDIDKNFIHRTIYFCSLGNDDFANRLNDTGNKYVTAGFRYEIVEADVETKKKADEIDKEIRAIELLAGMKNDEERIRMICNIMRVPGYRDNTTVAAAFIMLRDIASNTDTAARFGSNRTYQDRFIELAEMQIDELRIHSIVFNGLNKGRIRKNGKGGYLMDGRTLEGVKSEPQLVEYFRSPDNQEDFIDLREFLNKVANAK